MNEIYKLTNVFNIFNILPFYIYYFINIQKTFFFLANPQYNYVDNSFDIKQFAIFIQDLLLKEYIEISFPRFT